MTGSIAFVPRLSKVLAILAQHRSGWLPVFPVVRLGQGMLPTKMRAGAGLSRALEAKYDSVVASGYQPRCLGCSAAAGVGGATRPS